MWLALLLYLAAIPIALTLGLGLNWLWIWKLRSIPGPLLPGAFFGNIALGSVEYVHYKVLYTLVRKYGPVYKIFLGQMPYIVVSDPALLEQICTRQFVKFHDRVPLPMGARVTEDDRHQFETNIFWASGKQWGSVRSACEPLFHSSSLKSYAPIMHESIDQWLALLEKLQAGGKSMNILSPINGLAMSVLGKANFGVDFDCQSEEPIQLVKEAFFQLEPPKGFQKTYTLIMFLPMSIPLLTNFFAYIYQYGCFGKTGRRLLFDFAQSEGYINGTTKALLKNARRGGFDPSAGSAVEEPSLSEGMTPYRYYQLKGQAKGARVYKDKVPNQNSFVPKLVEAKIKLPGQEAKSLTDEEIVAQAYTMIIAGSESPANGMSHTLFELAKNPAVQAKLIEEIDSLGPNFRPGYEDMSKLRYTEACFQEGLRMHPVGNPMFSPCRVCTQDTVLGGHKIPKGVGIMLNSPFISRDPKYFPEPDAFKPERHIPGTPEIGPETRLPTCHMPFGYGPHGCIGKRFAVEQAVLMLTRFFQLYTISVDEVRHPPGVPMWHRTSLTFQPDYRGLWLHLHPRTTVSRHEE